MLRMAYTPISSIRVITGTLFEEVPLMLLVQWCTVFVVPLHAARSFRQRIVIYNTASSTIAIAQGHHLS